MRNLFKDLALVMLFLCMTSLAFGQVSSNGQLQTSGSKIVGRNGQVVQLKGPSLFWSSVAGDCNPHTFYTAADVVKFKKEWGASIIRAAYSGYQGDPQGNKNRVNAVVQAAIDNDMYVIIDWHDHHAHERRDQAISFFREMASNWGGYDNVIFEIFNEPEQIPWSTVKWYAKHWEDGSGVIPAIREFSDNLVIVGTTTWCQDVDAVVNDEIDDSNVAYALHFYASDSRHQDGLKGKAEYAIGQGIPLFVSEWGACQADGNGDIYDDKVDSWLGFMDYHQLSSCMWAVNDKDESSSYFTRGTTGGGSWSDDNLRKSGWIAKEYFGGGCTDCGGGCDDAEAKQVNIRIEAEDFCDASEVQTDVCTSGEGYVGWIDDLDWMIYKINIPSAGEYTITYSVASLNGGAIQFEAQGGTPSFGTVTVPSTGDWCHFTTIKQTVNLPAGEQNYAIAAPVGGWNIDWFEITDDGDECIPVAVPAKIEAEDYCQAHDIDTEDCSEGTQNVGWINPGSWMKYRVIVPSSGAYTVNYRVASYSGDGAFELEVDGLVVGSKTLPNTGAWQNWETISHNVQLNEGEQDLYIRATASGWNINWFEITTGGDDEFTLTIITSGNGSVTKSPDLSAYPDGTPVTLTAIPGSGSTFTGWSGAINSVDNPVTIIMDGNKTVSATFSGGGNCNNPTLISTPFTHEGQGIQCWVTSDELGIINSWSLDKLEINGVDYTNKWANGGYPAKIDGKYYITFESSVSWGHFEASGNKSAGDFISSELTLYPNPAAEVLFIELSELEQNTNLIVVDMTGKQLINQLVHDSQIMIDISSLESGIYMIKVNNSVKRFVKK